MKATIGKTTAFVARFFKDRRLQIGVPIEEVAAYLGRSIDEVAQFESGQKAIPFDTVVALSNILSIPPDEITHLFYDLALDQLSRIDEKGFKGLRSASSKIRG